jgi:hypothetical protein
MGWLEWRMAEARDLVGLQRHSDLGTHRIELCVHGNDLGRGSVLQTPIPWTWAWAAICAHDAM